MHDVAGCDVEGCYKCKLASLQIAPSAMPSRRNDVAPRPGNNNWEKGIVRDAKGQPVIRPTTGKPIGLKELADNRHKIERELHDRQAAGLAGKRVS